ncbi:protein quaking isoform X6 [Phasianus colchicus]|uniref:protein quaking isoform X6 n=1 Tax=Phasianus colchicus TaxID=9054 RepID=UPI00129EC21B|nr:protein quaking isoform X6 [Phasianus colchicus]
MVGEMEAKEKPKPSPDYLMQLMNDKKLMSSLPNFCGIFNHLERLLDEEISRVRKDMYNDTLNGSTEKRSAELPDAVGPIVQLQEKLYVPVKEYPDFNFVGRILGPRGLTAKQLEAETGCKIMVRGKGSMRDKKKVSFKSRDNHDPAVLEVEEEQNRGKPNWEHLNEDLHVLITVEDAQNRAEIKLKRAVEEVKKLLIPAGTELSCVNPSLRPALYSHSKQDDSAWQYSAFHASFFRLVLIFTTTSASFYHDKNKLNLFNWRKFLPHEEKMSSLCEGEWYLVLK